MRRVTALGFLLVAALLALTAAAPAVSPVEERLRIEAGDLDDDRPLGEVAGYTAGDSLDIDDDDLSPDDLEAVKYRSMARIEEIRGHRFEDDVALEVMSRERYRAETSRGEGEAGPFVNEVWRGAFVVDGETDVDEALAGVYGDAVVGYYSEGRIVLVAEERDSFRLNRATLVHELVHALQDQRFGLGREGETIDERRAETGLIEGEAEYVPALYDDRCGEWECLPQEGEERAELRERPFDVGLYLSIYAPYAAGPPFVASLRERGDWEAVGRAFEERPASTEQLLHPDRYPDDHPRNVSIEDRSGDGWEPFTEGDEEDESETLQTETVGEATLFATLFENGVVSRPIDEGTGERGRYNYSHPATDGWEGDTVLAYRGPENRTGHVWELAWESERDATEFADAYRDLLDERGAERINSEGHDTYRIPENRSFAGAYRLTVASDRVTVVGGPTADSIEEIRPTGAERATPRTSPAELTAPLGTTGPGLRAEPIAARAEPG